MKQTQNESKSLFMLKEMSQLFQYDIKNMPKEILKDLDNIIIDSLEKQKKLIDILIERILIDQQNVTELDKMVFHKLKNTSMMNIKRKIKIAFTNDIEKIPTGHYLQIDYKPLQQLLINEHFQEADKITQMYLCQLAKLNQNKGRNWLYFTDIILIPKIDLFIIDRLWQIYSDGKFGFTVQKKIWINNNKNWDIFLQKIGWIEKKTMKRYPNDFNWTMNAPKGHLPLFNQLRGKQVLYHLFKYIQ